MDCKHEWVSVKKVSTFGVGYVDQCRKCNCEGMLSTKSNAQGLYVIVATPVAKVIDLNEFRKQRKSSGISKTT